MTDARSAILSRLGGAPRRDLPDLPEWSPPAYGDGRLANFTRMLEASKAEIHEVTAADWPERLLGILGNRGIRSVLYAPQTEIGRRLSAAWPGRDGAPALVAYDQAVEQLKAVLVHDVDAGITSTKGGIAETGTLILWPTADEPRLMSLLPPLHIALIDEETLVSRHADARAFLADLKRIGAHLPVAGHQPLSAGEMRRVLRRFEQTPGIGVSYRIVYGVFKSRSGGRGAP